jgi:type VI secretion system Hcp family effector
MPYASRCFGRSPVIAAFVAACSATPALGAVNAYLVVDGIDGASTSRPHAIDILSFSTGASRAVDTNQAARVRRLVCQGINVMKVADRTTPLLVQAVFTGRVFPTATVVYDKPVGDRQQDYFTIQLSNATIASVQESGSNENPTESVSFVATDYTFSFRPEKDDGTLDNPVVFSGSCSG